MKIATWNLERPRQPKTRSMKNEVILEELGDLDADLLILTETNSCIDLKTNYVGFPSNELKPREECQYTAGENRVTIWVRKGYAAVELDVIDPSTSVCLNLETEHGELVVYGTIIGILGHPSQNVDEQIADWRRVSELGSKSLCVAGDFNIQFNRFDPFTNGSKEKILACLSELQMKNLTGDLEENIDHVAISKRFLSSAAHSEPYLWNLEKKLRVPRLSDHIGVSVTLDFASPISMKNKV